MSHYQAIQSMHNDQCAFLLKIGKMIHLHLSNQHSCYLKNTPNVINFELSLHLPFSLVIYLLGLFEYQT